MRNTVQIVLAAGFWLLSSHSARAADLVAQVDVRTVASSNVFLDKSEEWDLVLRPSAELGVDFARYWSLGYTGELNAYTRHADLLSHWHEIYLFLNPAWGDESENEVVVEASLQTLRNQEEYQELNLLQPALTAKLIMEPRRWLRWKLSVSGAYRYFYDDKPSDSLDAWARGQISFTLPTRTTISPRVAYGHRNYTHPGRNGDSRDQQVGVGLHASQSLSKTSGLQFDYVYLHAVGDSGILSRKLTLDQFTYLGEEFLYSGHRVLVGYKQLVGKSSAFWLGLRFEQRDYAGWPAIDSHGRLTGENRSDWRLSPRVAFEYNWWPKNESCCVPDLKVSLEYRLLRQWSNHDWYDTTAHVAGVSVWGSW
jgi:hypothetical protein